ncbi:MAG: mannosyl-3-phosphoglycerate phosphatase, partial [Deltaproteobacteria bacterium]|nr:mannosyl-3-phosphoglycerate phosphatase [Deltaproteobacteria bacterium]
MVRGDRFFHVMRDCDKGKAVAVLLDLYRRWAPAVISVGLGNSANDAVFLQRVDRPFAIRNPDGDCDSALIRLPSVTCSRAVGPAGW